MLGARPNSRGNGFGLVGGDIKLPKFVVVGAGTIANHDDQRPRIRTLAGSGGRSSF